MKVNNQAAKADVRIELIPLIDVVFCILTFFMLAAVTLTRQEGINVDLPRASSGVTQMREMLLVSVDPVGLIYVEEEAVSPEELQQRLLEFREAQPGGIMVLYASRLASYNDVVQVLDILRSVGGDRVALATLPDSGLDTDETFSFPPSTLPPGATFTPVPVDPVAPGADQPDIPQAEPQGDDAVEEPTREEPLPPDPLDANPFQLPQ